MFKIKGREVIEVPFTWTLEELNQFMQKNWNTEEYGVFEVGRPTPASIEEYILLPATKNYLVIAYPRKGKVIFSVADSLEGATRMLALSIPTKSIIANLYQASLSFDRVKEMKGPAADICEEYAKYMRGLLAEAGLI